MTTSHLHPMKTILIVVSSLLVAGGICFATYTILDQLQPGSAEPSVQNDQSSTAQPAPATGADADRIRAEQLLKDGKLAEAKTAYQSAEKAYTSDGNIAAAADAVQQIAIIDATLASQANQEASPQQADNPRQAGSPQ